MLELVSLLLITSLHILIADTDIIGKYGEFAIIKRTLEDGGNRIEIDSLNEISSRPTAYGTIEEPISPAIYHKGLVDFPDDREYILYFYPDENKIYWDGERGQTTNIWTKTEAYDIYGLYDSAEIRRISNNEIEVDWIDGTTQRPTANGYYYGPTSSHPEYSIGEVTFPDDRKYILRFYPNDNKIYWDGIRGQTSNIWNKSTPSDILNVYMDPSINKCSISITETIGNGISITWHQNNRVNAYGTYQESLNINNIYGTGIVTFPDDPASPYIARYYPDDGKIYWNGLRGTTNNIWEPCN